VLRTAEVARQACRNYCKRWDARWVRHLG
jgi:hypothetical protein